MGPYVATWGGQRARRGGQRARRGGNFAIQCICAF